MPHFHYSDKQHWRDSWGSEHSESFTTKTINFYGTLSVSHFASQSIRIVQELGELLSNNSANFLRYYDVSTNSVSFWQLGDIVVTRWPSSPHRVSQSWIQFERMDQGLIKTSRGQSSYKKAIDHLFLVSMKG